LKEVLMPYLQPVLLALSGAALLIGFALMALRRRRGRRNERIAIVALPPEDGPPYAHLLPIVDALVRHGNSPVTPDNLSPTGPHGFYMDKDGWRCDLRDRLDVGLIARTFDLPPTITVDPRGKSLSCRQTWIEVAGGGA
jgi:hypothetical protein